MDYLKKFKNHSEYEAIKNSLLNPNVSYCANQADVHYKVKDYKDEYLTFEALEDSTFTLTIKSGVTTGDVTSISYSTDSGETWIATNNVQDQEVTITTPTIAAGNTVLWKGNATRMANSASTATISVFSSSGNYSVRGNIMSLLYGDDFEEHDSISGKDYVFAMLFYQSSKIVDAKNIALPLDASNSCYRNMFRDCGLLKTAPKLPATTVYERSYMGMFQNCTSLTTTPDLPAATLDVYCYSQMFYGCTSLTVAPELPATTLATYCYFYMFYGCGSLTTAPELPATTLADGCYANMFYNCTSLTTAPNLPAIVLSESCYDNMFRACTSLTVAPELSATTLFKWCYRSMFHTCRSLVIPPKLPSTTLATYCYAYMFINCSSLTCAPSLPATELLYEAPYQNMFQGCTSLVTAPDLPATVLSQGCYYYMFAGCTSLKNIPDLPVATVPVNGYQAMFNGCRNIDKITCLATDISASGATTNWVSGVAASGTFTKAALMEDWTDGANGIPTGWTVKDAT